MRSRYVPNYEREMIKVGGKLERMLERLLGKASVRAPHLASKHIALEWHAADNGLLQVWKDGLKPSARAWEESAIAKLRRMREVFVISPVDKLMSDGVIMCPQQWALAVRGLGKNMRGLTLEEFHQHWDRLHYLDRTLKEVPYCSLKRDWEHQCPTLKVWLEWKSLGQQEECSPTSWAAVKYRPMSSFVQH